MDESFEDSFNSFDHGKNKQQSNPLYRSKPETDGIGDENTEKLTRSEQFALRPKLSERHNSGPKNQKPQRPSTGGTVRANTGNSFKL